MSGSAITENRGYNKETSRSDDLSFTRHLRPHNPTYDKECKLLSCPYEGCQKYLPFDCEAALQYGFIVSERTRQGRPISVEDAQIAAIALTSQLVLATRNVKDFKGIKALKLVNPWSDGHSFAIYLNP